MPPVLSVAPPLIAPLVSNAPLATFPSPALAELLAVDAPLPATGLLVAPPLAEGPPAPAAPGATPENAGVLAESDWAGWLLHP